MKWEKLQFQISSFYADIEMDLFEMDVVVVDKIFLWVLSWLWSLRGPVSWIIDYFLSLKNKNFINQEHRKQISSFTCFMRFVYKAKEKTVFSS